MSPNRADLTICGHGRKGCTRKIRVQHSIAVEEKNKLLGSSTPSCITADGCGRPLGIDNNYFSAILSSQFCTVISRRRIRVNQLDLLESTNSVNGFETPH